MREALGYGAPHLPPSDHYPKDGNEWVYGRDWHSEPIDSGDWREKIVLTEHRYVMEDVRLGLSLLVSAADLAGVDVPAGPDGRCPRQGLVVWIARQSQPS